MGVIRKRAQEYAEQVLSRPRGDVPVLLRRGKSGVTLLHQGRALTCCHASRVGNLQAVFMAQALGLELPLPGGQVTASVSTGVLYRAVAISSLDLRRSEARQVLRELLATAELQRTVFAGPPG